MPNDIETKIETQETQNNGKSKAFHYAPSPSYIYMTSTDLPPQQVLRQTPWYLTRLYMKIPPSSPQSIVALPDSLDANKARPSHG